MGDVGAIAAAVSQVADKAGVIQCWLASNRRGKELAGRSAQVMDAGCLTDDPVKYRRKEYYASVMPRWSYGSYPVY